MLRLHHGYNMLGHGNCKFAHQREGPFRVKKRIGALAYGLDLPPGYTIHPVISVAHLERIPDRPRDHEPGLVAAQDDDASACEIERLLGRRVKTRRRRPVVQYLVKWVDCSAAANQCYDLDDLDDAVDLVKDYDNTHQDVVVLDTAAGRAPGSVMRLRNRGSSES